MKNPIVLMCLALATGCIEAAPNTTNSRPDLGVDAATPDVSTADDMGSSDATGSGDTNDPPDADPPDLGDQTPWADDAYTHRVRIDLRQGKKDTVLRVDVPILQRDKLPAFNPETVRFFSSQGGDYIHEHERSGIASAETYWVRGDFDQASHIWMYWGSTAVASNPAQTWEEFSAVYHFAKNFTEGNSVDGEQGACAQPCNTGDGVGQGAGLATTMGQVFSATPSTPGAIHVADGDVLTVSLWYASSDTTQNATLVDAMKDCVGWRAVTEDGQVRVEFGTQFNDDVCTDAGRVKAGGEFGSGGGWHNLVFTVDRESQMPQLTVWIDGNRVDSQPILSAGEASLAEKFAVGATFDGTTPFIGRLDEFRMIRRAATDSEVAFENANIKGEITDLDTTSVQARGF
ncbi:MAG: LamG-like jellyroll fold domain-containing protein [bacterium]